MSGSTPISVATLPSADAHCWLRLKGWRILARRYCASVGEIDLIAKRGKIVTAIEVKARHSLMEALEAVTPH